MYFENMRNEKESQQRNSALFDNWSIVHLVVGIAFGWIMDPFVGLLIMTLWEPFEIFILSPTLSRFGITFGYESAKNSMSDIVFNIAGLLVGVYVLGALANPPLNLFK